MPRPKLKSDDEVLDAATAVLKRLGPTAFTLADVAKAVGLSRATLIQRFTSRDVLLVRMMERAVAQVRDHLDRMPSAPGPEGAWTFLQALVREMGTGYEFSVNVLISWYETQVPELRALAAQRNRLVQEAIERRLPADAPAGAGALLHAVVAGAAMQWVADPEETLADAVLARVAVVLRLMFPRHEGFAPGDRRVTGG
jgi:TetR/AcrR family macrolide resistance operon transcriptional repressor